MTRRSPIEQVTVAACAVFVGAAVGVVVIGVLGTGCASSPSPQPPAVASSWPEADALWTRANAGAAGDFLGGDSAYSVPLGGERVAWFFGDSFIATDGSQSRRHAKMVRNAVAIQTGLDPSAPSTTIQWFVTGDVAGGAPSSFFHAAGDDDTTSWVWPGTPALVDDGSGPKLLVFLWNMKATQGGGAFGFQLDHTSAVLVDNPGAAPSEWHQRVLAVPLSSSSSSSSSSPPSPTTGAGAGYAWGTGGALVDGDTLWLLAAREPGDHRMGVARLSVADAAAGNLDALAFVADAGWNGPTELSLSKVVSGAGSSPNGAHYVAIGAEGFVGNLPLAARRSTSLAAPSFSAPSDLYRPTIASGAFDYSAKAHPELTGANPGELVVTYCTNADLGVVVDDMSLYFPRFVRITP